MNTYTTGFGQVLHNVHAKQACEGRACGIHNPVQGPWSAWPTYWRDDSRIMERICPHGVGHPAVEQYDHLDSWRLVHGCCGCPCSPRAVL